MKILRPISLLIGAAIGLLLLPSLAFADTVVPAEQNRFLLPSYQLYILVIGSLVPLIMYVVNHNAPWASDKTKGLIQLAAATIAGALYQALDAGNLGFNDATLTVIVTAIVGAFGAHKLVWRPTGIATSLGAGTNAGTATPDPTNVTSSS